MKKLLFTSTFLTFFTFSFSQWADPSGTIDISSNGNIGINAPATTTETMYITNDVSTGSDAFLKIKNSGYPYSYGQSGIKFGNGTASIYTSVFPAWGSGSLSITNGTGKIYLSASQCNVSGGPGPGYSAGDFNVGGLGWMQELVVSNYVSPGSQNPFSKPSNYKFAVNGLSYMKFLSIGGTFEEIPSGYSLAVNGKIICEELKVELSDNWGDFVFDDDYALMSLEETEEYIKENKHLPGIETAEELEKEGVELGEMVRKQMVKIEELTLHTIQQNKEIENQKTAYSKQQEKIDQLESLIIEQQKLLRQQSEILENLEQ